MLDVRHIDRLQAGPDMHAVAVPGKRLAGQTGEEGLQDDGQIVRAGSPGPK